MFHDPGHEAVVSAALRRGPQPGEKVLSVRHPFAWMICQGYKPCENRTWTVRHRGLLWIHAARQSDELTDQEVETLALPKAALEAAVNDVSTTAGAVVGAVYLALTFRHPEETPPPFTGNLHVVGPYGWWFTAYGELAAPVFYPGATGLMAFDPKKVRQTV